MGTLARAASSPLAVVPTRGAGFLVAAEVALTRPPLWTLGLLGFLARGGLALLVLPIVALPSPVGLSILLGPDLFDANGLSARGQGLAVTALAVVAILVVVALGLSAAADAGAFERFVHDPATARLRGEREPCRLGLAGTAWLVLELALLQALLSLPAAVAFMGAAVRVGEVARQEILLPTRLDLPLTARVLAGSLGPLALVAALLVPAALLSARLGRELLLGRYGLEQRMGWRGSLVGGMAIGTWRLARHPLRFLGAWLIGGTALLVGLGLALGSLALGWRVVETVYLGSVEGIVGVAAVALGTVAFVAVFGLVLAFLGGLAALRAALLTSALLPGAPPRDWTRRGD